jgi:hypothetical protein
MTNPNNLTQHLLRTLLLEGDNGEKVLKAVRSYDKSKKTAEDHHLLVDTIKKEVTRTTREMLDDAQVDSFINEVSSQTQ